MAYEQGLLTSKSLNRIQKWALVHYLFEKKKTSYEKRQEFLKDLTLIGNPHLYQEVYIKKDVDERDKSEFIDREELHDIDAMLRGLEHGQTMRTKIAFDGAWH